MTARDHQDGSVQPPMTAKDYSEANDWPGYFAAVIGKPPRDTLLAALDAFRAEGLTDGFAMDLAAGEGRDALELLARGWRVEATDNHPDAFPLLWPRVPEALQPRLTTVLADFTETQVKDCDLVNASFALPFCAPPNFPELWRKIVAAIRPGGRFAGQFFGDRDTWASIPGRTHHSKDAMLHLLRGFDIEMLREEERDEGPDVRNPKHWHLFHVVAKKRSVQA